AVEQKLDLRLLERGNPLNAVVHEDAELLPVLLERAEGEVVRNPRVPRLGDGLEAAEEQAAHFFAGVDVTVVVAEHGKIGAHARGRTRDGVEVFDRKDGDRHAIEGTELPRPATGAVHDDLARDLAGARAHTDDGAITREDFSHRSLLADPRAARPRAGGQGLSRIGRNDAPVVRDPDAALEIVDPAKWPATADFVAIHDVGLDPRVAPERDGPPGLRRTRGAAGGAETAHLLPVGAHARLGLEPGVELGAVADEPGQRPRAAEAADEPRGMPGRAARELLALEQDDVAPAEPD